MFSFFGVFSGWCAGACVFRPVICFGLLCLSLCVGRCLVCARSLWCFCGVAGSCWPLVAVVFSSSVALLVFAFVVWGCFGLARSLLASLPPWPARPLGWSSGAFWSSRFLLVPPSGYLVVFATARLSCLWYGVLWLLGSCLHFSSWQQRLRPCGALPSTPCCGCCLGASLSCTEVFALGWSRTPLRTPLELHAPFFLACAASSLLSLLPSRAPSPSCCCWPPLAVFPLVPFRPLAFTARFAACVSFWVFFVVLFWLLFVVVRFVFVWCFWSALPVLLLFSWASPDVSLLRWLRIAEDRRPQHHTHTHTRHRDFLPPLVFCWRLVCPWIRLFFCLSWLSCCLVPLARLSCSVRGVGFSRPEPWTRLHCSELHWRDPVALSVGQPGAPVSSKVCAHGSGLLFRSRWYPAGPLGGWVEFILDSLAEPLGCDDAMHCRYGTETKTLRKHLNSSAGYLPTWRPVTMHGWECSFQLRLQAGHDTMFCWLCMLWQDFSPLQPGTVYVCPVMNLVSDGFWLVTYPALCDRPSHCHGAAPRKGGGTIAIWLPTTYSSCSWTHRSVHGKRSIELNIWARTCERTLRG